MAAPLTLAAIKAGITRLRVKGGASKDVLFDAVNCYVTSARGLAPRPGSSVRDTLPAGTIGLGIQDGILQVFSSEPLGGLPAGYKLNVLNHPNEGAGLTLKRIWKSALYMGALYVVAEWSDGSVWHYWLRSATTWAPNTHYLIGALVQPTVPNGFTYQASRIGNPYPLWQANIEHGVGDRVEPTTYNGFYYEVIEAYGSPPRSGATEPAWVAQEGAAVIEDADASNTGSSGGQVIPPSVPPGYENPGGSLPSGSSNFDQNIQ